MRKSKVTGSAPALRTVGLALLLAFVGLSLSGCLPLLVPSLLYQGYKATHNNETGETSMPSQPSTSSKQSSGSAADQSIE